MAQRRRPAARRPEFVARALRYTAHYHPCSGEEMVRENGVAQASADQRRRAGCEGKYLPAGPIDTASIPSADGALASSMAVPAANDNEKKIGRALGPYFWYQSGN